MRAQGRDAPQVLALLRLIAAPRIGRVTLHTLLRRYGTPVRALDAIVRGRAGLSAVTVEGLEESAALEAARRRLVALQGMHAGVLLRGHPGYPAGLERLHDAPTVLFYRGSIALVERPCVAIIGARRCTPYGREAARVLAGGIARGDYPIVSGLARGIDAAAHQGALEAGGPTIAVVGTGLDVAYPRENAALQERIGREGLVLSELLPGTPPSKHGFPERNRLIMALAKGMIVVEAGPNSGTRNTVEMALDHGVEVFAVPGPIGRPQSEGTHRMLREGAGLASSAEEVLLELDLALPTVPEMPGSLAGETGDPVSIRLLEALGGWELPLDALVRAAAVPVEDALPALLSLEMAGRVQRLPGARYAASAVATSVAAPG